MNFLRRFKIKSLRLFYFSLYGVGAAAYFTALHGEVTALRFDRLASFCLPVLAILFGFAALLYNRARAFPSGPEQRRSLYAAERVMQSIVMFVLGAALLASVGFMVATEGQASIPNGLIIALACIIYVGLLFVIAAFAASFFAFRTISHRFLGHIPTKALVRRLPK